MQPKPLRRSRASAFTLVEVMMAAAVLVLAIVGMIQVVVSGAQMLDVARKQTVAMQVIHGQLENIRLSSWTQVNALTSPSTVAVGSTDQASNIASGFVFGSNLPTICAGFTCTRTITTVRPDLKQVSFTVTWKGNTFEARTYTRSGSTYLGKNGLYVTYQRS